MGIAQAEPKRALPDYDGRGNPDADAESALVWIPRVVLFPFYVVHEYAIRRPLGALVTHAERKQWAGTIRSLITFGEGGNTVLFPTVLYDFGLLPSVGLYMSSDHFLIHQNKLRAHVATWGRPWIAATLADRYLFGKNRIEARFGFRRAKDNRYFGLGPDVESATESRYGLQKTEATLSYRRGLFGDSKVSVWGGAHNFQEISGTCCGNPSVRERVNAGELMLPPAYGESYSTAIGGMDFVLDTRLARPKPGSGAYLRLHGQPSFDVEKDRSWIQYGAVAGQAVDVTGRQRVLKMQVAVTFLDRLGGSAVIPFTEYPVVADELMPGFTPGWLRGRSTAVAQLGYTWPIWIGVDGQTRASLGNAFGQHLDGLVPSKLRWSWDIGLMTNSERDQGFEVRFGLGSETIEQGAGITSVRVAIGSRQGF